MQDPDLYGFHHLHLRASDPEAVLDWYQKYFGGEKTRYGGALPAIRYSTMWLIVQPNPPGGPAPETIPIDHFSFGFRDFDTPVTKLKEAGTRFTIEPRPSIGGRGNRIAWIQAPGGVKIEITELLPGAQW